MKHTPALLSVALLLACAGARASHAAATCPDDPERCVVRGATVTRSAGSVALSSAIGTVTATPAVAMPAPHKVAVTPAPAPAHKPAKASRAAAPLALPTPATPGMGMLLKLSAGAPGEVSWFPSKPADNSGASWVL